MTQAEAVNPRWTFSGRVTAGVGQGAGFTGLDWVQRALRSDFGIEVWPGTLNLLVDDQACRDTLQRLLASPGTRLPAGQPGACDARCYPVRLAGRLPAAVVVPEVAGYPEGQLELVAALPLRRTLGLADGDHLEVSASGSRSRLAAAIFDVDGTLVNSVDAYHIAAGRAAEPLGYAVTREQVREALNSQRGFWDLVLPPERCGDRRLIAGLREATMRHWPEVLASHVSIFEGLQETLASLQRGGLRLAIYTGSRGESFAPLEQSGLLARFEFVLTAAEVKRPKPDPQGLLLCLERLGLSAAEAVYIGDSVPDMAAAEAAGMLAVGMLTGAADSATLSAAGAHRLAADHRALPAILGLG